MFKVEKLNICCMKAWWNREKWVNKDCSVSIEQLEKTNDLEIKYVDR
jgi:hypothetical protein